MYGAVESVAAVSEQSAASAEEVWASTEEQTASVEEMSAGAQELAAQAAGLREVVSRFVLEFPGQEQHAHGQSVGAGQMTPRRRAGDWPPVATTGRQPARQRA
jgi:hypothetical protein